MIPSVIATETNGRMARRILVVDDDALVLRAVTRVLGRMGFAVDGAADVATARGLVDSVVYDAAIVDYQLAQDSGLTVLALLIERQPRAVRILFTGRSDPAILVDAINRGEVAKVLRKPFEPEHLRLELEEAFGSAERNRRLARESLDPEAEAEHRALDEVVAAPRLGMALQPLFDLASGAPRICGFEALLRPDHPRFAEPHRLLAAAERHGRVLDVGRIALARAGALVPRLAPGHLLFVNVHPEQLADPERLDRDLLPLRPAASRVVLEITERTSATRLERWEESMAVIARAGFETAVDDLGAGYNSLSMLADLKPRYIKLDRSLVHNVHREPRKQRLAQLMRAFADATEARVVGEGVECEEEVRALLDVGVDLLQGFHLAHPSERIAGTPPPVTSVAT